MRRKVWLISALFIIAVTFILLIQMRRQQCVIMESNLHKLSNEYLLQLCDLDGDGQDELIAVFYGISALLLEMREGQFVSTQLPIPAPVLIYEFKVRTTRHRVVSYLGSNREAIVVMKDSHGKVYFYPFAQDVTSVRTGDWDEDGLIEEILICTNNGRVLRLFKRQPDGSLKQVSNLPLPASIPPVEAVLERGLFLQNRVFLPIEVQGNQIVLLPRGRIPQAKTDLDNDGKPEKVFVERNSATGEAVLCIEWGDPKSKPTRLPLGQTDLVKIKAAPLIKGDEKKVLFCFKSQGPRWSLEVWSFSSRLKQHLLTKRPVTLLAGNWGFVPTTIEVKLADFDGDNRFDIFVEALQPPLHGFPILGRLFLKQLAKGWKVKLERFFPLSPFTFTSDSPVWFMRSDYRQVLTRKLTYWRLHSKPIWHTDLLVMTESVQWKRKARIAGKLPAIPFQEFVEFADLNSDGTPELVTLREDVLGFERTLFWWFEPKKGWQAVDLGPSPKEQIAYMQRNFMQKAPITLEVVVPIRWDDHLWLTMIWSDGKIKAVRVP